MVLDVNKEEMIIMGVKFDNRSDFDAVWYSVSSNMIEGWVPRADFIVKMKERIAELRKGETIV